MVELYQNKEEEVVFPDRRMASSSDFSNLITTIQSMVGTINQHETRIVRIETKQESQDDRLGKIEVDVRDTKDGVQKVLDRLTSHTAQEDKDRAKLLSYVIGILLTTISGIIGLVATHFLGK
ncbi:hypothetical protein [Candidatus Contendibacter odensensis]|uniref:Uncharacterized protein n=1 Tax=Candidatus Contendobacter odensis Run_B_J11 TaxID=1400861 RepID=A0A7U7G8G1_9GAMM|nr:hypothetical protein [Candidatus Contendobacter odensis]CDH43846.1 hypothetical protein BN874_1370011 [Candidatus Contendobacter odensis Run_B_J11]